MPSLLYRLNKEKEKVDFEIIVADAGSNDKTVEIAKLYNCNVIKGGLPAVGRNNGAAVAKGDLLLFLDADLEIPKNFLAKTLNEFNEKKYDIASFGLRCKKNNFLLNRVTLNIFYNYPQKILRKLFPMGAMGILVKKDLFYKIGGFDPDIKLAEDICFTKYCAKIARFGIIKSVKLYMPLRRFQQDGYLKTFIKYLGCALYIFFKGPPKKDIFKYNFDHYKD